MTGRNSVAAGQLSFFDCEKETGGQTSGGRRVNRKHQAILEKLDELTLEVCRLAQAQEQRIVYLPRPTKPRATEQAAVEFMKAILEREPRRPVVSVIRELKEKAHENGWRLGSKASLYRLAKKIY
jgi:DNA-binding IclR family transcriptional regulator